MQAPDWHSKIGTARFAHAMRGGDESSEHEARVRVRVGMRSGLGLGWA